MPKCHSCGEELTGQESTCPECGASTGDPTASFAPVGNESAGKSVPATELGDSPVLVVRKGPQLGERFYLESKRLVVGRDPECDIFLNDVTVSRRHAILTVVGPEVTVTDSASLNGTYVNGTCVDSAVLSPGDTVQIGTFLMVFYASGGSDS